jgi:hypothetical protein
VTVGWGAITDQYVVSGGYIEVEYRKTDSTSPGDWLPGGRARGDAISLTLNGIEHNVDYDVRARSINQLGAVSSWATLSDQLIQYAMGLFSPETPTGFAADASKSYWHKWIPTIYLSWTPYDDSSIGNQYVYDGGSIQIEFKKSSDSIWLRAAEIEGDASEYYLRSPSKDVRIEDDTDYDVRIRALTRIKATSAWSTLTSITVPSGVITGGGDTTDTGLVPSYRDEFAFFCHEQSTPDMTVRVEAGSLLGGGGNLITKSARNSSTITPPVSNPRIDRITMDMLVGNLHIYSGSEAASPTPPDVPAGELPLCQILLQTSTTAITNDMITDERPSFAKVDAASEASFAANDSTPSVSAFGIEVFKTANTSPTTITDFDDGYTGQLITVIINDNNTTIDFSSSVSNLKGNGGVDWSPSQGDHLYARKSSDGSWYCSVVDS